MHALGALMPSAFCRTFKVSVISTFCCDNEVWGNVTVPFCLRGSFIFANSNPTIFNISHILHSPCPTCCPFKSHDLLCSYASGYPSTKKQPPSSTLLPSSGIQKISSGRTLGCNVSYFATLVWLHSWPSLLFILSRVCRVWGFRLDCKIKLDHHSSCLPFLLFRSLGTEMTPNDPTYFVIVLRHWESFLEGLMFVVFQGNEGYLIP